MKTSNEQTPNEVLAGCGYGLLILLAGPLTVTWRGYVLAILWRWFLASQFGLPQLNIPQAIGVSIVVTYLTTPTSHAKREDERITARKAAEAIAASLASPAVALAFGAIVRHWL